MKIHQYNAGHMTKVTTMPIYGKTVKNTLEFTSQEPLGRFDETLYEASET